MLGDMVKEGCFMRESIEGHYNQLLLESLNNLQEMQVYITIYKEQKEDFMTYEQLDRLIATHVEKSRINWEEVRLFGRMLDSYTQ